MMGSVFHRAKPAHTVCRRGHSVKRRLAGLLVGVSVALWAAPTLSADICAAPTTAATAAGHLGTVDRKILGLTGAEDVQPLVRGSLCGRNSVYAFLQDNADYAYGRCFVDAARKKAFWGSSHDEGERLLAAMMQDCQTWAGQRYAGLRARIEENARRRAAEESARQAKAQADAQAEARARAETARRKHAEDLHTALTRAAAAVAHPLTWDSANAQAAAGQPPSAEVAAYLLGFAWRGEGDTAARARAVQETLQGMLGAPRVATVAYREGHYEVTFKSSAGDYAPRANLAGAPGLETAIRQMRVRVTFAAEDAGLLPHAVVLDDAEHVLSGVATGATLAWPAADARAVTFALPADAQAPRAYRGRIACVPTGGGSALPLRRCLKGDGVVETWSPAGMERRDYATADKNERELTLALRTPFGILMRTGGNNLQNMLTLVVEGPADALRPVARREEAIGARAQVFVRGVVTPP